MGAMELTGGPKPAATKGSTSNGLFTVITSAVDGRKVQKIRPHLHLGSLSGDIELRVMVQTSDDLVTWSSPSTLTGYTTFVSSAGWTYGSTWVEPTGAPYFRLGLEAQNINNSERDCARVRLAVDLLFT